MATIATGKRMGIGMSAVLGSCSIAMMAEARCSLQSTIGGCLLAFAILMCILLVAPRSM